MEVRICQGYSESFERVRPSGRPPKYCGVTCRTRANNKRQEGLIGNSETCWPRSPNIEEQVCAEYLSGLSTESLKVQYGVNAETIRRVLRRNGVALRHRNASTARKRVKGARVKDKDGYVHLLVDPGDALYVMTQAWGNIPEGNARYALEHRVVMARHIGRPLYPWENVHHKNGDRA